MPSAELGQRAYRRGAGGFRQLSFARAVRYAVSVSDGFPDADSRTNACPTPTPAPTPAPDLAAKASGTGSGLLWAAGGAAATAGVYTLSGAVKRRFGRAAKKK